MLMTLPQDQFITCAPCPLETPPYPTSAMQCTSPLRMPCSPCLHSPCLLCTPGLPSVPGHSHHHHHDDIEPDGHHHLHLCAGNRPHVLHCAVQAGAVLLLDEYHVLCRWRGCGFNGQGKGVPGLGVVMSDEGPLPGSPAKRMAALAHFPLLFSQLVHHIVIVVNEHVFFALSPHRLNWLCDI